MKGVGWENGAISWAAERSAVSRGKERWFRSCWGLVGFFFYYYLAVSLEGGVRWKPQSREGGDP